MQRKAVLIHLLIFLLVFGSSCTFAGNMVLREKSTTVVQAVSIGNRNAVVKAKQYLSLMAFSKNGLKKQLKYDGFTSAQAKYGVKKAYK